MLVSNSFADPHITTFLEFPSSHSSSLPRYNSPDRPRIPCATSARRRSRNLWCRECPSAPRPFRSATRSLCEGSGDCCDFAVCEGVCVGCVRCWENAYCVRSCPRSGYDARGKIFERSATIRWLMLRCSVRLPSWPTCCPNQT